MNRSEIYWQIEAQTRESFETASRDVAYWRKHVAPKWRNRVGLPRLIAERVLWEALGLVRSISANVFRNEPEMMGKFYAAVAALDELASDFAQENWRRFEGEK